MKETRFIPVCNLPSQAEFDPEAHRLSWAFRLTPSVDEERIVLDTAALKRIQAVAAFRHNHVVGYLGDRT